jgi:hypothetical protein
MARVLSIVEGSAVSLLRPAGERIEAGPLIFSANHPENWPAAAAGVPNSWR